MPGTCAAIQEMLQQKQNYGKCPQSTKGNKNWIRNKSRRHILANNKTRCRIVRIEWNGPSKLTKEAVCWSTYSAAPNGGIVIKNVFKYGHILSMLKKQFNRRYEAGGKGKRDSTVTYWGNIYIIKRHVAWCCINTTTDRQTDGWTDGQI